MLSCFPACPLLHSVVVAAAAVVAVAAAAAAAAAVAEHLCMLHWPVQAQAALACHHHPPHMRGPVTPAFPLDDQQAMEVLGCSRQTLQLLQACCWAHWRLRELELAPPQHQWYLLLLLLLQGTV